MITPAGGERPGVIELFCGAGGFTWGWQKAGYQPLAALDADVPALRTHELNFGADHPLVLNRDLALFDPQELRSVARPTIANAASNGRRATLPRMVQGRTRESSEA